MPKTVLITGANRGLGLALTKTFAFAGFDLLLHCRNGVGFLKETFPSATIVEGDFSLPRVMDELEHLASEMNVDVLINNAGVYLNRLFHGTSISDVNKTLSVNLLVPIFLTQAIWPTLTRNRGIVVFINSIAANSGGPGESIYSASKAGLQGFAGSLQYDANPNISVINVNLGAMSTGMTEGRNDWDKLINTSEVAEVILDLCKKYDTLRITSVDIKRRLY